MNATDLWKYLDALPSVATGFASIMIRGNHGIGKSAVVKQWAAKRGLHFIDIRLGQRDVGDIIGMPALIDLNTPPNKGDTDHRTPDKKINDMRFKHIIADLMRPAFEKPSCLFVDEYNRGTKDVQQAMFEVVLDRTMNGTPLYPETWVFAACNSDLDVYTVTETDPAFMSRFSVIDFKPSIDEWLKWAKETNSLCEEMFFMFKTSPEIADPPTGKIEASSLSNPHPNRRSWTLFSHWFNTLGRRLSLEFIREVAATFVGNKAAEVLRISLETWRKSQKIHDDNDASATSKAEHFYRNIFVNKVYDVKKMKKDVEAMNPSDLEAIASRIADELKHRTYGSKDFKQSLKDCASLLPDEMFTKIWIEIKPELRQRIVAEEKGIFDKYQ